MSHVTPLQSKGHVTPVPHIIIYSSSVETRLLYPAQRSPETDACSACQVPKYTYNVLHVECGIMFKNYFYHDQTLITDLLLNACIIILDIDGKTF